MAVPSGVVERRNRWVGFGRAARIAAPMLAAVGGLLAMRLLARDVASQQELSRLVRQFGEMAPLVFVLALTVRPLTLLPGQLMAAVGGMVFGALAGTVYALVGSFLSCGLIFVLARFAGGTRLMRRLAGRRYRVIVDVARANDFKLAGIATISPLIPTDVYVATAASAGARFSPTVLGVLFGTLPGTAITAQFGSALGQGKTLTTAVSIAGMALSLVLGLWLGRRVARRIRASPNPASATAAVSRGAPGTARPATV